MSDELLARRWTSDDVLHDHAGTMHYISKLRAALATQPRPLFKGEIADAHEWLSPDESLTGQVLIETTTPWRDDLGRQQVVVYPATATSAAPTGDDHEDPQAIVTDLASVAPASVEEVYEAFYRLQRRARSVAGSATPILGEHR